MHEKTKCVCFIYMQPEKVKFKSVQINMKQVSYYSYFYKMTFGTSHIGVVLLYYCAMEIQVYFTQILSRKSCHDV